MVLPSTSLSLFCPQPDSFFALNLTLVFLPSNSLSCFALDCGSTKSYASTTTTKQAKPDTVLKSSGHKQLHNYESTTVTAVLPQRGAVGDGPGGGVGGGGGGPGGQRLALHPSRRPHRTLAPGHSEHVRLAGHHVVDAVLQLQQRAAGGLRQVTVLRHHLLGQRDG